MQRDQKTPSEGISSERLVLHPSSKVPQTFFYALKLLQWFSFSFGARLYAIFHYL